VAPLEDTGLSSLPVPGGESIAMTDAVCLSKVRNSYYDNVRERSEACGTVTRITLRGEMTKSGWHPANRSNYTVANRPISHPIDTIIIHTTQLSFASTLGRFENALAKVSAHYTVRFPDGFIVQSVREKDIAWHAGNWTYNQRSIGIEHEGYVDNPAFYTDAIYRSSAQLAAYLVHKYSIPVDRCHIIGHDEVPSPNNPGQHGGVSGHHDPGAYFDWDRYMDYVRAYLP
jgi:N-acetyl-anhydromuramyl-L-alanine amidase AmpD